MTAACRRARNWDAAAAGCRLTEIGGFVYMVIASGGALSFWNMAGCDLMDMEIEYEEVFKF